MSGHPALSPLSARGVVLWNRLMASPRVCDRAPSDGRVTDAFQVRHGPSALGRAGLVLVEAVAVGQGGRSDRGDLEIDSDDQLPRLARLVAVCHGVGAAAGIRLTPSYPPLRCSEGRGAEAATRAFAMRPTSATGARRQRLWLSTAENCLVSRLRAAADRAFSVGFDIVELDVSSILRRRLPGPADADWLVWDPVLAVREAIPSYMPLMLRLPAFSDEQNGRSDTDVLRLAQGARELGVDLISIARTHNDQLGRRYRWVDAARVSARLRAEARVMTVVSGDAGRRIEEADALIACGAADLIDVGPAPCVDLYRLARHRKIGNGAIAHVPQQDDAETA